MISRRALSQSDIEHLSYTGLNRASQTLWDRILPGFGVRVYPTGQKAFIIKYRIHGRQRTMTLGSTRLLTVDDARNRAKRAFVQLLDRQDPLAMRQQHELMFDELAAIYLRNYAIPHKKTGFEDERRIQIYLLPAWKNRSVSSITRLDVLDLHQKIADLKDGKRGGPYSANRVRELIQKMFSLAKSWEMVPDTFRNPAVGIKDYKEIQRDRYLNSDEVKRLAAAISEEPNVYICAAIWLYLLTGLRKQELLRIQWNDIDWNARQLRLAAGTTKTGRPLYQPLSVQSLDILRTLPRTEGNPHVFASNVQGRHLVAITKAWHRIRKDANLDGVRIHDLRRTCGSWLAQSGSSLQLIGKVLNHSNEQSTAVYAHLQTADVRAALEQHGELLAKYFVCSSDVPATDDLASAY
ncbi:MAG: site-specific integrase [Cyanobacteria bacterium SZAS-4]|nr:site-specific integrase [Cyanobacteria bacterium SZAS-4]